MLIILYIYRRTTEKRNKDALAPPKLTSGVRSSTRPDFTKDKTSMTVDSTGSVQMMRSQPSTNTSGVMKSQPSTNASGVMRSQPSTNASGMMRSQASTNTSGVMRSQASTNTSGVMRSQASTNTSGAEGENAGAGHMMRLQPRIDTSGRWQGRKLLPFESF